MNLPTFTINLEETRVEAGSSIRGSIDFEVQRSIYANALRVTFIGEERTRVAETNTKRSAEESHVLHSFVEKLDRVIRTGKIRIGKFSLEFTIPVPLNCPPTIGIPWTRVTYYVGYELEDRQERVVDQDEKEVVILSGKVPHPQRTPFYREPFLEFVKKSRFKKGHLVITCKINDTVLEPGEKVGVSVAIRNRSPLKIVKVKALLKQEVRAYAMENLRQGEKILTFHEFVEYRKLTRKRKNWLRGTHEEEDIREVQEELESGEHDGELRVPATATPTFTGTLFDVKHYLYLLVQTDKDDIDIRVIPIILARKEPLEIEDEALEETDQSEAYDSSVLATVEEEDDEIYGEAPAKRKKKKSKRVSKSKRLRKRRENEEPRDPDGVLA